MARKYYSGLNSPFQWQQKSIARMDFVAWFGSKPDTSGASSYLRTGVDILNIRLDLFDAVRRVGVC